jgi:hypothetical protein
MAGMIFCAGITEGWIIERKLRLGREPINLQGVRLARVRYCPDSDQIPQRSELSRWVESRCGAVAVG